jgi:hypothetical protein
MLDEVTRCNFWHLSFCDFWSISGNWKSQHKHKNITINKPDSKVRYYTETGYIHFPNETSRLQILSDFIRLHYLYLFESGRDAAHAK